MTYFERSNIILPHSHRAVNANATITNDNMPALGEPCGGYGCVRVIGQNSRIVVASARVRVLLCSGCVSAFNSDHRIDYDNAERAAEPFRELVREYSQE